MNAKAILICGKICSGKSFYAEKLRKERGAVLLSVDEITLALFGQHIGEKHDEICARTQKYLFEKSVEIIESGIDVILDWGFWRREDRTAARNFYESRSVSCEFHYVDISDGTWRKNLDERNRAVSEGSISAYFVDENLAAKFAEMFEAPDSGEMDVWYENTRS
ncbi:MAG: ATP-binding protein [Prevotella sp.]|nr:ATP-binding protein [Prevotella sp.]